MIRYPHTKNTEIIILNIIYPRTTLKTHTYRVKALTHICIDRIMLIVVNKTCQHLNECTKHILSQTPPPPQKVYTSIFSNGKFVMKMIKKRAKMCMK